MFPLISVIVPIYNSSKFLNRCIDSILDQDYTNIEIILIDDGSTDDSLSICRMYTSRCPSLVRLIIQENMGASIARKNGIVGSKGDYLMFVDSDDYVARNYVSSHYKAISQFGSDIAISPYKIIKSEEDFTGLTIRNDSRLISKSELFDRFFKYEFWGYGAGCYKRSLFDDIDFPSSTVYEDYYVKIQLFCCCERISYIDRPLYFYEKHDGSLSQQKLSLKALGEFDNACKVHDYVSRNLNSYRGFSIAIVAEVISKWFGVIKRNTTNDYIEFEERMRKFVKENFFSIITSKLYWKIKIMLMLNFLI